MWMAMGPRIFFLARTFLRRAPKFRDWTRGEVSGCAVTAQADCGPCQLRNPAYMYMASNAALPWLTSTRTGASILSYLRMEPRHGSSRMSAHLRDCEFVWLVFPAIPAAWEQS